MMVISTWGCVVIDRSIWFAVPSLTAAHESSAAEEEERKALVEIRATGDGEEEGRAAAAAAAALLLLERGDTVGKEEAEQAVSALIRCVMNMLLRSQRSLMAASAVGRIHLPLHLSALTPACTPITTPTGPAVPTKPAPSSHARAPHRHQHHGFGSATSICCAPCCSPTTRDMERPRRWRCWRR